VALVTAGRPWDFFDSPFYLKRRKSCRSSIEAKQGFKGTAAKERRERKKAAIMGGRLGVRIRGKS